MLGDRLRLARKRASLSLRDLAERMGHEVSAQAISKYESGKMHPSSGVLLLLARNTSRLCSGLLDERPGRGAVQCRILRALKDDGRGGAALAEATVIDVVERHLALDAILGLSGQKSDLPSRKVIVRSFSDVEREADGLREKWKLGLDPIPSVTGLLEDKGIKIVAVDFPNKLSGLTGDVRRPDGNPDVPVIAVSNDSSIERRRFTLAHELAHRVIGDCDKDIKAEKAMDRFAAAFLIPARHLQEEVQRSTRCIATLQ